MGRDDVRDNLALEPDMMGEPIVARLPHSLRIALVLRERAGLSDQAIAAQLRIDVTEVPRPIHDARIELRRLRHTQVEEDAP